MRTLGIICRPCRLYFLVDLYFVGRLGKEAVAAVSLAGNIAFIVLAVTQMLGVPAVILSQVAGFELRWIWYLSVASVALQMLLNLYLLQREFRKRLDPLTQPGVAQAVSG